MMVTMVRVTISKDLGMVLVEDQAGLGPTTTGLQEPPTGTTMGEASLQALGPPQVSVH